MEPSKHIGTTERPSCDASYCDASYETQRFTSLAFSHRGLGMATKPGKYHSCSALLNKVAGNGEEALPEDMSIGGSKTL